ncbi:MAG: hypothetical protein DMG68_00275 [Acidobacteria bacterium]|nr:MAG: hypothetical protein DMG68_00275 [Acidobacteriota bacterium]
MSYLDRSSPRHIPYQRIRRAIASRYYLRFHKCLCAPANVGRSSCGSGRDRQKNAYSCHEALELTISVYYPDSFAVGASDVPENYLFVAA